MKTEQELKEVTELFDWYLRNGGLELQSEQTAHMLMGAYAAMEWLLGRGRTVEYNPINETIVDIRKFRKQLDSDIGSN